MGALRQPRSKQHACGEPRSGPVLVFSPDVPCHIIPSTHLHHVPLLGTAHAIAHGLKPGFMGSSSLPWP